MATTSRSDAMLPLSRAFALGLASGLRSVVGFSMLALTEGRSECRACAPAPLRRMRSERGKAVLAAAAAGEAVVDKLPFLPPRTTPAPLAGRLGFGAVTGFLATRATPLGRAPSAAMLGALLGATGAAIGAYAGFQARTSAVQQSGLPDPAVAAVEDAVALALASLAARA